MSVLIAIEMYPVSEVCKKLAELKERDKGYDRQQVDAWIKRWLPTAQKFGNLYMLTCTEIKYLAEHVRVNKTRRKNIDI